MLTIAGGKPLLVGGSLSSNTNVDATFWRGVGFLTAGASIASMIDWLLIICRAQLERYEAITRMSWQWRRISCGRSLVERLSIRYRCISFYMEGYEFDRFPASIRQLRGYILVGQRDCLLYMKPSTST